MEVNPYQSSEMADGSRGPRSGRQSISRTFADRKYLVVPSGTRLPPVCIKTNEPVSDHDMIRRTYHWFPQWTLLSILISLVAQKKCDIVFGLHPRVRSRQRRILLAKVLICVACFVAIFVAAGSRSATPLALAIGAFVVSFIVACLGNSPLRLAEYRDGLFWIKGCCPEFLDAMDRSSTAMRPEVFVPPFPGRARR